MKKNIQLAQLMVNTVTAVLTLVLVFLGIQELRGISNVLNDQSDVLKHQTSIEQDGVIRGFKRETNRAAVSMGGLVSEDEQPSGEASVETGGQGLNPSADWLNGWLLSLSPAGECAYENDDECDAIGFSGSTNLCPVGTDTHDCEGSVHAGGSELCIFENDGECDAEGLWKSTNRCPPETDEADCGGFRHTSELCRTENDGACDAMGIPGSTNQCPVATDLIDCRGSLR